ncbi:WecB/TagA/CpsF family glycosyltransferase [uncultured Ferrovibrio sp.]|jgi:N-acetylglucosaminyldiphosphoundecaprenol N-acetyl-beta-D-mannosaminyltransferase|uniref:WecB/TagA/CpsF family glycosyltransferase n=1 Tax=uncultured Ferrovibrio sp. TaxID=1576913 RepID=UPI0026311DEE|nr:WecB/TagA/CpsF family glycosyltransferase [uncultured Ferrovibrio sp.]
MHPRPDVFGVPLSALTMDEVLASIDEWIRREERHYICTIDVHALVESQFALDVRDIYRSAAIAAPDGMPLVWLLRYAGHSQADRICGPDLMPAVFRQSQSKGYRHFLYGSSEETLSMLRCELNRNFPGARVVGHHSPPFRPLSPEEEREVDRLVNAAEPDIVWVGLGAPKQDRWMAAHRSRLNAPILIGVGGAFEMMAGKVRRAPPIIRRTGFEWVFRMIQEPRRLSGRYLKSNIQFLMMLASQRRRAERRVADI